MAKINHIGMIVDGNGRWAQARGKARSEGHLAGSKMLEKLILYISENNIANYLSLYVFSTENFNRSKEEVDYLMNLVQKWFKKYEKTASKYNIKIVFSSKKDLLKKEVVETIEKVENNTKDNTGLVVNFCLSYGGRMELVEATKKIAQMVNDELITVDDIDEELFSHNLFQDLPPIDLLIRTSGEMRISNFMPWQLSYAEFYFTSVLAPDFTPNELEKAISEYENRDRRFGKVKK